VRRRPVSSGGRAGPRRQSAVRAKAEGEAVLHADTGTTDVVVEAGAEFSCVVGFGMGASSEECYHCGAMAMQALVVGMGKEACGFKRKAGGRAGCTDGLPVGVGLDVRV
jgi:hypothetical protein